MRLFNDLIRFIVPRLCQAKKASVSDLIRNTIFEEVEDEIDLKNFDRVLANLKNPFLG